MKKRDLIKEKRQRRERRQVRVRARGIGTIHKPRLSVFRSNYHIRCQLINDENNETILSASDKDVKLKSKTRETKTKIAYKVGEVIAKKAREKGIKEVFFDRSSYKYHGRVEALAEGARAGGLKF